jgi:hypothetical protein
MFCRTEFDPGAGEEAARDADIDAWDGDAVGARYKF